MRRPWSSKGCCALVGGGSGISTLSSLRSSTIYTSFATEIFLTILVSLNSFLYSYYLFSCHLSTLSVFSLSPVYLIFLIPLIYFIPLFIFQTSHSSFNIYKLSHIFLPCFFISSSLFFPLHCRILYLLLLLPLTVLTKILL